MVGLWSIDTCNRDGRSTLRHAGVFPPPISRCILYPLSHSIFVRLPCWVSEEAEVIRCSQRPLPASERAHLEDQSLPYPRGIEDSFAACELMSNLGAKVWCPVCG